MPSSGICAKQYRGVAPTKVKMPDMPPSKTHFSGGTSGVITIVGGKSPTYTKEKIIDVIGKLVVYIPIVDPLI